MNLIEVPEKSIFIVGNSAKKGDSESPRPPDFSHTSPPILMFPQNPIVFLVHANAVLQCLHSSKEVGEMSIKVLDVTKTITALHNFKGAYSAKSNNSTN